MSIVVYHNPECGTSRNVVEIIQESGVKPIIIEYLKSQKNKTEIKGMKNAHIRDGAALVKFIYWIKNSVPKKKTTGV